MEPNHIPPPPGQGPSLNPFGPYQPTIEDMRAGFGIRLGALVIDSVIAAIFTGVITFILSPLNLPTPDILVEAQDSLSELFTLLSVSGDNENLITGLIVSSSYAGAIGSVLYMLVEGFTGASIGKRLLKLTVARADGTAGNQSLFLSRMFVKNSDKVLHLIAILPLFTILSGAVESASTTIGLVLFIGCFLTLGHKRLALHDMVVKTAVFKTSDIRN